MNPNATTSLPIRLTSTNPTITTGAASLEAWNLESSGVSEDESLRLGNRTVGVRSRGGGLLSVEPVIDGAELVGHLVVDDLRPIPGFADEPDRAELSGFSLGGPSVAGYIVLASGATERLRASDPWFRRVLPAVAGVLCVPFAMMPLPAFASASGTRRGKAGAGGGAPLAHADAQTDSEVPAPAAEAPAPAGSPPAAATAGSPPATALPDSTWNGVIGKRVALTRADGFGIIGELLAVDAEHASVATDDGTIVVVPRASVSKLRLVPAANAEPKAGVEEREDDDEDDDESAPSYRGLLVGGTIMVSIGGTLAIVGAALTGYFATVCAASSSSSSSFTRCTGSSNPAVWAGALLVPGLLMTGGGAALLGVGVKRKKAAQRKKVQVTVLPRLQRSAWGGSLTVRF